MVGYYGYNCENKAVCSMMQADFVYGRREEILQRRKEVKMLEIDRLRDYNQSFRELVNAA